MLLYMLPHPALTAGSGKTTASFVRLWRIVAGGISIQPFAAGDVNKDGKVNLGDIVLLVNFIFKGGLAPDPHWLGDVKADGSINLEDLIFYYCMV